MTLAALSAAALLVSTASAVEARVVPAEEPRKASIAAGLGGSWIFGGNAAGYGGALAERVMVDLPTGPLVAFTVELDHARHTLRDADAYFPSVRMPAGSITGFRDYFAVDVGFRFGIPVGEPAPGRVSAMPFLRLGVGVGMTSTLLDAPGFAGRVAMRSNTIWPAPSLGAGAEVRIRRWISLLPHAKAQVLVVEDTAESAGGPTRVAGEWRFQPALDVRINF